MDWHRNRDHFRSCVLALVFVAFVAYYTFQCSLNSLHCMETVPKSWLFLCT